MQSAPLAVKLILQEGPELDLPLVLCPELSQRGGVPAAQVPRPLLPVGHAVFFLDGHV